MPPEALQKLPELPAELRERLESRMLLNAVRSGNIGGMRRSLEASADPNFAEEEDDIPVLWHAATFSDRAKALEMITLLIDHNAQINFAISRLGALRNRPEVAALIADRVRQLNPHFFEPRWLIEWRMMLQHSPWNLWGLFSKAHHIKIKKWTTRTLDETFTK